MLAKPVIFFKLALVFLKIRLYILQLVKDND